MQLKLSFQTVKDLVIFLNVLPKTGQSTILISLITSCDFLFSLIDARQKSFSLLPLQDTMILFLAGSSFLSQQNQLAYQNSFMDLGNFIKIYSYFFMMKVPSFYSQYKTAWLCQQIQSVISECFVCNTESIKRKLSLFLSQSELFQTIPWKLGHYTKWVGPLQIFLS
ncbi:hypothetical protein FGO68_gene5596 [Halteria grandinella]|uniref:Uncharacterized protein n=1 Tax=Halteria grandinella TaxID=5974 RepID=A0A8J8NQ80_HALGN|nr:hypothetical protein FGO68_gene5596 [Halteria grandinella]